MSASFLQAQPFLQSANNAANYDPTAIALGSMFVVFGNGMGPFTLVSATQLPLPNTLAGTSVTVTSGGATLNCPMFYTSFGQVVAVMPSNTPLGTATVNVIFNSQSSAPNFSATVNVVTSSVGMFTPGSTGLGPGIFTDALTGAHITLANPATPGELLTGWATGVGPLPGADNQVATTFPNFPGVQVWVGGQAATMSYAGRSGCCVAVDQLNFFVPKTGVVYGCSVPVFVTSNGRTSTTTTIPLAATAGTACSDTGPTLPSNLLTSAAAGAPLKVGVIAIAPTSTLQPAARQPKHVADQLSAAFHVPVSVEDATKIMNAAEAHNSKALKSALSKYSAQWKALSSRAKARLAETVGSGQAIEVVALFGTVTNESFAASTISAQIPAAGSCVLLPSPIPLNLEAVSTGLDAGASLSLVGAAGSITVQKKSLGDYEAPFQASPAQGDIPTGSYTLSGNGHDLSFNVTVTVAGHPAISNKAALAQINRSQPLTITWTGGTPGQFVMIGGFSGNHDTGLPPQIAAGKRDFICSQAAETGTFTIPAYIMQSLWPTPDASGALLLSYGPTSQPLTIPGLDGAWFLDGSSDIVKNIVFK
jgi:uncharacterized protein (TIGR03437 family)